MLTLAVRRDHSSRHPFLPKCALPSFLDAKHGTPTSSIFIFHQHCKYPKPENLKMSTIGDNEAIPSRLFGRQRPIHEVLGGEKVANILLWRNPKLSAILLLGITLIWALFEVIEYSFVSLLCHLSITTMLGFFIWCTLAELFRWKVPEIPEIILDESTFKQAAVEFHARFNQFLSKLLDVACGKDLMSFFMAIGFLLTLSIVGNYVSSLSLLYISYVCMQILPFLYERYENDVDYIAGEAYRALKRWYWEFDTRVLAKIPRGPVRDRKTR